MIVVIKLVALITDDVPVRCRENMTKSTDGPLWAMFPDSGGQNVHPLLLTTNINQGSHCLAQNKFQDFSMTPKVFSRTMS